MPGLLCRVCFVGDVCGAFGVSVLLEFLPPLIQDNNVDFVVVNAENADNGSGLTVS